MTESKPDMKCEGDGCREKQKRREDTGPGRKLSPKGRSLSVFNLWIHLALFGWLFYVAHVAASAGAVVRANEHQQAE